MDSGSSEHPPPTAETRSNLLVEHIVLRQTLVIAERLKKVRIKPQLFPYVINELSKAGKPEVHGRNLNLTLSLRTFMFLIPLASQSR